MRHAHCGLVLIPLLLGLFSVCGIHAWAADASTSDSLLDKAAEDFYTATSVSAMRAAVERALAIDRKASIARELSMYLAILEARTADLDKLFFEAIADPDFEQTRLQLALFQNPYFSFDQWDNYDRQLELVVKDHPDASVRATAANLLTHRARVSGRDLQAGDKPGLQLPLAIIGTWENDQGKGFHIPYPPESEIELGKTYLSRQISIGWRDDLTPNLTGIYDLTTYLYPTDHAVAYGAAAVRVAQEGDYELHLTSSSATKAWVDDVLIFQEEDIDGDYLEMWPIPVHLAAGVNRILIKSANRKGSWKLGVRLTLPDGKAPAAAVIVAADAPFNVSAAGASDALDSMQALARRLKRLNPESIRYAFNLICWARLSELNLKASRLAESLLAKHPNALALRYELAMALWGRGERERTSDLLNQLAEEAGEELLLFGIKRARFLGQNKMADQARDILTAIKNAHPDRRPAYLELDKIFEREGWNNERLQLLEEINRRWPGIPDLVMRHGFLLEDQNDPEGADKLFNAVLERLPYWESALQTRIKRDLKRSDLDNALALAERYAQRFPEKAYPQRLLGDVKRRQKDWSRAEAAYRNFLRLSPANPHPYRLLAKLYDKSGQKDKAIEYWQLVLERDPNDAKLANRLAYLAKPNQGPWIEDIPSLETIQAAIDSVKGLTIAPGANAVRLLDHMVVSLMPDGGTTRVVTEVDHVVNEKGRDRLTEVRTASRGRVRVLHAFVIDPQGRRIEASSIRDRVIRFRKLQVGATVAVQYRVDAPPKDFLREHFADDWWFQEPERQVVDSHFILWAAKETRFREYLQGDVQTAVSRHGAHQRRSYRAQNIAPLIPEPYAPPLDDVARRMALSSVPDWQSFVSWESALLKDVFVENSELVELARRLASGETSPSGKLDRIHAYLMSDIRYEQDYESAIMGVRPHAAPVVLARRYGDCKDKSVLFIALAKQLGIEAHFALIRTRDRGRVMRDVPMQQFDHVIVYVPAQTELKEGRFYDSTTDALDVGTLRADNQGALAFVVNPATWKYEWRDVPFQAPEHESALFNIDLKPDSVGGGQGRLRLVAEGSLGSMLRRAARNQETFAMLPQKLINTLFPGARVLRYESTQLSSVDQPAALDIEFAADRLGQLQGDELHIRFPFDPTQFRWFDLARRKLALDLGQPSRLALDVTIAPPENMQVLHVPKPLKYEDGNFSLARESGHSENGVRIKVTVMNLSNPVSPERYAEIRGPISNVLSSFNETVSFRKP